MIGLLILFQVTLAIYVMVRKYWVYPSVATRRARCLRQRGQPISSIRRAEALPPALPASDTEWEWAALVNPSFNIGPFPSGDLAARFESAFIQAFMDRLTHHGYEDTRVWRGTAVLPQQEGSKVTLSRTLPAVIFGRTQPDNSAFYAAYAFDRSGRNVVVHYQHWSLRKSYRAFEGLGGCLGIAFSVLLTVAFSATPGFGIFGIAAMHGHSDPPMSHRHLRSKVLLNFQDYVPIEHTPLYEAFRDIHNEVILEANEQFIG